MRQPKPGAPGAKRFYKTVAIEPRERDFAIVLDGKPIKTPAARPFVAPTRALAEAIAEEWRTQGDRLRPASMPLTQMLNTAIDRMGEGRIRDEAVAEIAAYAATDLVCYRAAEPPALAKRQAETWQPLLEWMAARHGARLAVTHGFDAPGHPAAALSRIAAVIAQCDPARLAGLHVATGALGSVVIALALADGEVEADVAFRASQLDDLYQIEKWGEDAEAAERLERIRAEIAAAAAFLGLAKS